jgi:hypothetical protein
LVGAGFFATFFYFGTLFDLLAQPLGSLELTLLRVPVAILSGWGAAPGFG